MQAVLRLFFLFITLFNLTVTGQEDHSHFLLFDEIIDNEKSNYQNKTDFSSSIYTSNYDVSYYRLDLTIRPDTLFVKGNVTIYFTPNQNLQSIFFDLNTILHVDSIRYNNQNISFTHTNNRIEVTQSFPTNKLDSLTIYYQGSPPKNGTSFKSSKHNDTPIIWTLSEPYGALDWWPCKQSLTDKADSVDMFVTAPKENKVAGVGTLISETIVGNLKRTYWKSRYPITTYLVALAVTPYAEISFDSKLSNGKLLVQNYIYKEDSAQVHSQLLVTDTLLQFYDSVVGEYPFMNEKYGHAQFGRGGGMEHQTMSFMSHFGFALNAHEMAHQWFGDKITCGSWSDIWLNEGFATYFAGLPLETMYDGKYWPDWKTKYLDRATLIASGSIYVTDTTDVGRVFDPNLTYAKGGYVLHMLRKQIGDSLFFKGIKSYISDPKLAYSTALTDDFFRHMELAADTNLETYKNQWIYGKGFPSFNLEWTQHKNQIQINLSQITADPSVSFFYLDVPIRITGGNGEQFWLKIKHIQNNQEVLVTLPFTALSLQIDPNLDLISKSNFVLNTDQISEISLYPNPTSNTLFISLGKDILRPTGYQVVSADGKIVIQVDLTTPTHSLEIDVKNLSHGTYQIIIFSETKKTTRGFVVID